MLYVPNFQVERSQQPSSIILPSDGSIKAGAVFPWLATPPTHRTRHTRLAAEQRTNLGPQNPPPHSSLSGASRSWSWDPLGISKALQGVLVFCRRQYCSCMSRLTQQNFASVFFLGTLRQLREQIFGGSIQMNFLALASTVWPHFFRGNSMIIRIT
jgi:hypothetical protein